jgi:DNA-binding transcriptional regulator LsrR (DeoR family)
MKELYADITDLYDEQGLDVEEIAAILSVPEQIVAEVIADFEEQLDATYGDY